MQYSEIQQIIISLQIEKLLIFTREIRRNALCINVLQALFADAEMLEDVLKDGVGGDFAYDVGEVVDAFAEVLGDEVAGELEIEPFFYSVDGGEGLTEGREVAGVGDDGVIS